MVTQSEFECKAAEARGFLGSPTHDCRGGDTMARACGVASQAPVPWLKKFCESGGLDGLARLLTNLCRFNQRSDDDWLLIDAAMRCTKAVQRTPEGIDALVRTRRARTRARRVRPT
eukprot:2070927-Pleurochrysis_carterae.AAC.1